MLKNKFIISILMIFAFSFIQVFGQDKKEEKLKACGTKDVNYKATTDKKQHPTPEAPEDKALIYVLRPTIIGYKINSKLAVDGEWKGVNRGKTYFFFTVESGEHYFCSESENQDYLKLEVEAGKTYYLQQKVEMGMWKARTNLVIMKEEEGRKKLEDVNLSVFEEKQK
ncbi:MAG: DUF2846 domain-containing protein [Pyrinomonadaceae bacterium]